MAALLARTTQLLSRTRHPHLHLPRPPPRPGSAYLRTSPPPPAQLQPSAMASTTRKRKSRSPSAGVLLPVGTARRTHTDATAGSSSRPLQVVVLDNDFDESPFDEGPGIRGDPAGPGPPPPTSSQSQVEDLIQGDEFDSDDPLEGGPVDIDQLATQILAETFGHHTFRHEQEAAIRAILSGKNALVIFPTGAGKSLCFQIPALAFERIDLESGSRQAGTHGISIVVSPLLALMKDQVDALQRKGVAADRLDSTRSAQEARAITLAMQDGSLRLLYCAPERLNNEGFVEAMKRVKGGVRLVAVDEAHCISEWGHSFRPDYLKVARFVEEIRAERVLCLTATATPRVADDICKGFAIAPSNVYRTPPYRPNLRLEAQSFKTKEEKTEPLLEYLKKHPGPSIIYVTLQRQAETMAELLRSKGFTAQPFHAGLDVEFKKKVQEDFMANKIRIIAATIAFGMGIDKPDIRNIIHHDMPSTIEEYSQQIGRAGRDGKQSQCMTFVCPEDFYIRENFARGDLPSRRSIANLIGEIASAENTALPVGGAFLANHYEQAKAYDIKLTALGNVYALLELRFGLVRAVTPEYSEYKFLAEPSYGPAMAADPSPAGRAIREHAVKGVRAKMHSINVPDVVKATGLRRGDILHRLNNLHDAGVIQLKPSGVRNRYRITSPLPDTPSSVDALVDGLYTELQTREVDALRRCGEVTAMISGAQCLARALAEHFGMSLPCSDKTRCGHCTFCETGAAVEIHEVPRPPTNHAGIAAVLAAVSERDDPRFLARIAFGIRSPRVAALRYDKSNVFMSLADHEFTSLLAEFEKACGQK